MVCEYEYDSETQKMRVNCIGCIYGASIEDSEVCMARTIDKLIELKRIPRIVFAGDREYEYDFSDAKLLFEIANAILKIQNDRIISFANIEVPGCERHAQSRYQFLRKVLADLRYDPVRAYKSVVREIRHINIKKKRLTNPNPQKLFPAVVSPAEEELYEKCSDHYIVKTLMPIKNILENCRLIQLAKIEKARGREFYRKAFHPTVRPNFMYTRYVSIPPANAEVIERYKIGETQVEILQVPGMVRKLYHIIPPEFQLSEEEYSILDNARRYLGRHEPRTEELAEPERFRENIFNIGLDMLRDITTTMNISIDEKRMKELADILTRYTAGLGTLELFLSDENIQDIVVNSPIGRLPIYVFHSDHQECETNIIPSMEDAESWATRFRLMSGRPLDEANPVLDTELIVPGGRARVAAITRTLSPDGLGFAFRRHRERPWTYPLFIKNRMIDSFSAGLMWFLIDGARTILIAGTRSSGKCVDGNELLQLSNGDIVKIGPFIEKKMEKNKRFECDDGFYSFVDDIEILTLDDNLKIVPKKVSCIWKRRKPEKMVKIITSTGKEITTTPEHPYFVLDESKITAIQAKQLKRDMRIATTRRIATKDEDTSFSLNDIKSSIYVDDVSSDFLNNFSQKDLSELGNVNYSCARKWLSSKTMPVEKIKILCENKGISLDSISYKKLSGKTTSINIRLPDILDEKFAEFLGYLFGDGSMDESGIQFTNLDRDLLYRFLHLGKELFDINGRIEYPKKRSSKAVLQSKTLARMLNDLFDIGFGKKADKIQTPSAILRNTNTCRVFLKSYFDCDASVSKTGEVELATASGEMAKEIQLALARFGIISFSKTRYIKNKTYYRILIRGNEIIKFAKEIGFSLQRKQNRLQKFIESRKITTTNVDSLPGCGKLLKDIRIKLRIKPKELRTNVGKDYRAYENEDYYPSAHWFKKIIDFYKEKLEEKILLDKKIIELKKSKSISLIKELLRTLNIKNDELKVNKQTVSNLKNNRYRRPREKILLNIISSIEDIWKKTIDGETKKMVKSAELLANSDVFWDKIVKIEKIKPREEWVYDLTVEDTHNFVANGFIAHNTSFLGATMVQIMPKLRVISVEDTLELPVVQLRELGYNVERLKSRSVITRVETEMPAEEALRTALRLGDSCLIIGEVRSVEVKALYEAMRIGALANVVAGTIHGDSAYGVFDRVVNDLGVNPTSFKATDIILICNMLTTPDGIHRFRRITDISEVRKHWKSDPLEEGGFVNLCEYSAKDDILKPSKTLLMGESQVLNDIASRVREWKADWNAVWDNINLRARILQTLVDYSRVNENILESNIVMESNSLFHLICDEIRNEMGFLDSDMIYNKWLEWLKKRL